MDVLKNISSNIIWVGLLKKNNFIELPKIIRKIFSIPISNAFVELVFSLMENLWCDERKRLSVEIAKSELCVKLNYNMNCKEFLHSSKNPKRKIFEMCKK